MPWVKLDDGFAENEKVTGLTDRGFRLHVTALCYCGRNLTDGYVSARTLRILAAILSWANAKRWAVELAATGMWIPDEDGGYQIHDFHEYNPTSDEVKVKRAEISAKRREAGKKGAANRWQTHGNDDGKGGSNGHLESEWPRPTPASPERTPRAVTALRPAALGESGNGPGEISIDHVLKDIA
jgi:hypothetical protein